MNKHAFAAYRWGTPACEAMGLLYVRTSIQKYFSGISMLVNCQHCGDALPKRNPKARVQVRRYCSARCRKAASRLSQLKPSVTAGRCDIPPVGQSAPLDMLPRQPHAPAYVSPFPDPIVEGLHGSNPDGSTPGALQGDDYPIGLDGSGYPILAACLDRRHVERVAADLAKARSARTSPTPVPARCAGSSPSGAEWTFFPLTTQKSAEGVRGAAAAHHRHGFARSTSAWRWFRFDRNVVNMDRGITCVIRARSQRAGSQAIRRCCWWT